MRVNADSKVQVLRNGNVVYTYATTVSKRQFWVDSWFQSGSAAVRNVQWISNDFWCDGVSCDDTSPCTPTG